MATVDLTSGTAGATSAGTAAGTAGAASAGTATGNAGATSARPSAATAAGSQLSLQVSPDARGPVPPPADERPPDRPRSIGSWTSDDAFALVGCAIGSFAGVWIAYYRLLPFSGAVGFLACWFAAFLVFYGAVSALSHPRPVVWDRLVSAVVYGGAGVVLLAVASTVIYTFAEGRHALLHLNFYTHDMAGIEPTAPLSQGGIEHAIVGTLIEVGIAVVVSLPLGIGAAVFMTEFDGRFARVVRTVVEAMTALPDILAGLFIYTTLIVRLGFQASGFAAALALSVMMLPIIARSAEVVLRVVPGGLREASYALGASHGRTVWSVVLPTARSGLATALILGIARGVGETAPVLLTSGASTFFNDNPFHYPMNSLPLFIYNAYESGDLAGYTNRLWGAASVLLGLVLILFIAARVLARTRTGRS